MTAGDPRQVRALTAAAAPMLPPPALFSEQVSVFCSASVALSAPILKSSSCRSRQRHWWRQTRTRQAGCQYAALASATASACAAMSSATSRRSA